MKANMIKAVFILVAVIGLSFLDSPVGAQVELYSQGACNNAGGGDICAKSNDDSIAPLVQVVINALLYIAGAVSLIFMLVGGLKFITSAGDPGKAASGRNTVLYALAGILVSSLAFVIVQYIYGRISPGAAPAAPGGVT